MAWDTPDPYHQPEAFDLTFLGQADAADGYEYDLFVVWTAPGGVFRYGYSTGCSCYAPFESEGLDALAHEANRHLVIGALQAWFRNRRQDPDLPERTEGQVLDLIGKILAA